VKPKPELKLMLNSLAALELGLFRRFVEEWRIRMTEADVVSDI
jgi:hypothetical protein